MDRKRRVGPDPPAPPPPKTGGLSKPDETTTPKTTPIKKSAGRSTPQPSCSFKGSSIIPTGTTTPQRGIWPSTSKQPVPTIARTTRPGIKPVSTMGKKFVAGSRSKLLGQPVTSTHIPKNDEIPQMHRLIALQNHIFGFKETLAERNTTVREQQTKIHRQGEIIKNFKADQTKSNLELNNLKKEISSMSKLLNDEALTRNKLLSEARRRDDVENEQGLKLLQFEAEAALREEDISRKTELIKEQELCISKLKKKLACGSTSSRTKLQDDTDSNLSNTSKACRASISNMQANLAKDFDEVKRLFDETRASLRSELGEAQKKNLDLMEVIAELQGQLEASRKKEEMNSNTKISQNLLHDEVVSLKNKIEELENDLKTEQFSSLKVDILEGQLMQMTQMNGNLKTKVESLEEDAAEFETWMKEKENKYDEIATKLLAQQRTIVQVDKEIQSVLDVQTPQDPATSSSHVLDQLEGKLTIITKSLALKEEQFATLEKSFGLSKVDLDVAHGENKELVEKNSHLMKENTVYSKEIEVFKKISQNAKAELLELKETLAKKDEQIVCLRKNLDDEKEKARLLEVRHNQSTEVSTGKIGCLEIEVKQLEEQLGETKNLLEEKEDKIQNQRLSLGLLREATKIQEEQLKKFEDTYSIQVAELDQLESEKKTLSLQVLALQEALSRANSTLEDGESRQKILESRIKNEKLARFMCESKSQKEIKDLEKTVQDLSMDKADLSQTLQRTRKDLGKSNSAREDAHRLAVALEKDNENCADEITQLSRQNMELLKEIGVLREDISEAMERAENMKNRYETLSSHNNNIEALDVEVLEDNVKLKETIRQQLKLIEFLQTKNKDLLKRKERRFQMFGKGSENVSPLPKCVEDVKPVSTRFREPKPSPRLTPVNLVREHFQVQQLEQKRDSLRTTLASLQEVDPGNPQASSLPIVPPKKECCCCCKVD